MKHPDKTTARLEAAMLFLKVEDGQLSKAEKAAFLAWLRSSPVRVAEYLRAARVVRYLPLAFKEGPIQDRLIDTLLDAVPGQLGESERRIAAQAMLESLYPRLLNQSDNQADPPLSVTIRRVRKGNGVSRDSGVLSQRPKPP